MSRVAVLASAGSLYKLRRALLAVTFCLRGTGQAAVRCVTSAIIGLPRWELEVGRDGPDCKTQLVAAEVEVEVVVAAHVARFSVKAALCM